MEKLYLVPVRRVCTDNAYVWAEDAENAQEIAQELAENGTLQCVHDMDGWEEQEAQEATEDPTGDKATADDNREAYKEFGDYLECDRTDAHTHDI